MSGLCGWFEYKPERGNDADIAAMAATLARFDGTQTKIKRGPCSAVAAVARSRDRDVAEENGRIAGVVGQVRFTNPDLANWAGRHGIASALLEGHRQQGADVLKALSGSFAVAVFDSAARKGLLAVDRMGIQPLYFTTVNGGLVFGSALAALGALPGAGMELSRQAIYDYVYFHMVPGPQTIYSNSERLLPGTFLAWDNGRATCHSYWEMVYVENESTPFPELKARFLSVLRKSVSEAAKEGRCGAFLSGGTDSSTVAGMLREVTGDAPRTYSIGFDVKGFDEMGYARIAAQHFATRHHEYYVTPDDVVSAIPRIAALHDQPFGNSSAVPTYYCARLAKEDGIDILLAGDGGDELFGGNSRYAKQYLYSLYGDLPPTVRTKLIEPLAFALPAAMLGKVQRYMRNASRPMPLRYDDYNLIEHCGRANIFAAEFLDSVNAEQPQEHMAGAYHRAHAESLINRMLSLDLKYTLADNDLPKVTRACELARLDVRFPMLDDAFVAFSARLAPQLKLKQTHLRYFFKLALRDFLPAQIITKKKHGFGLPFGSWLRTHGPLEQIALDSLSDLKKRKIVRARFIDELTSVHVQNHAAYFGTMVWVLMMLEQWFARGDTAQRSATRNLTEQLTMATGL